MERLSNLSSQFQGNQVSQTQSISQVKGQSGDDVVICAALRTPLCKAKKGGLKDTAPEQLLAHVFKSVCDQIKLNPKLIEDVIVGNCLQPGAGALVARSAQFLAGFPDNTSVAAVNRQCSSGIEACSIIAAKIKSGVINLGIGSGVESMSLFDMNNMVDPNQLSEDLFNHPIARNCLMSMGQTSEMVCEKYGLNRKKLDEFAADSHRKAAIAQEKGLYKDEIAPIKVKVKNADNTTKDVIISQDDGIRKETTAESLGKLKPAFKKDGLSTAGNSSQVTDGAAAVVLARRSYAQKLGLPIIGKFVSYAVVGVPPEIMGIGPAYAIPKCLEKAGLQVKDIDVWELNEAFASQCTWCADHLGIDYKKINPKGGAIALGHPLGCTGARQVATLLPELKRTGGKYGVISMCIGTGMGAAALIERE